MISSSWTRLTIPPRIPINGCWRRSPTLRCSGSPRRRLATTKRACLMCTPRA
uniref:Helicase protein n=1 Tax=uncultured marine virus TaxID=186617 RepID=A0A0F7L548_9VIRU|nr:helicase protein [uncultured marine virus]